MGLGLNLNSLLNSLLGSVICPSLSVRMCRGWSLLISTATLLTAAWTISLTYMSLPKLENTGIEPSSILAYKRLRLRSVAFGNSLAKNDLKIGRASCRESVERSVQLYCLDWH